MEITIPLGWVIGVLIWAVALCSIGYCCIIGKSVYFKIRYDSLNAEKPHTAIILANNYAAAKYLGQLHLNGIHHLIKAFIHNKTPYKIYEPKTAKEFKDIIFNKRVTAVWVFGHGSKHHIWLGEKEGILPYCELKNAPKKEFVAQLHCNPGHGRSLKAYLSKKGYVPEGAQYWWQNRAYLKAKLQMVDSRKRQS